jgi:hypothetical protein
LGFVVLFVAAAMAACGGSGNSNGFGSTGTRKTVLQLQTTGSGAIQGAGADCRGNCSVTFDAGATAKLRAVADSGSTFAGWGGACSGTAATCDLTLGTDQSVIANFASAPPSMRKLTLALDGQGRVTSAPSGLDCASASCSADFAVGASVVLTAAPAAGWRFAGWSGACSGSDACNANLANDIQVVARFESLRKLIVTLDGSGRVTSDRAGIDCSGASCSADFVSGTSVILTATAAKGWTFMGWSGACTGTGTCNVNLAGDALVSAQFERDAHVTVSVAGPGQITGAGLNCGFGSAACDTTVSAGTLLTASATAGSQARFLGWSGGCSGSALSCTTAAHGEVRIVATFSYILTTLVPNDGTNFGYALAINSTDVFYGRNISSEGYSIWAAPKAGGQPRRVASGSAAWLVADDGYVYWSDSASIYSAPVGGGAASLIYSGAQGIGKLALDGDGALYWTASYWLGYQSKASVHRMQDRVDTVLVDNAQATIAVAVDDKYVYYGNYDNFGYGEVRRVPKKGGTVETVISCGYGCFPSSLRADFKNIYLRANRGEAWSVSKASPSLKLLSGPNGTPNYYAYTSEIDVSGSTVYWNWLQYGAGTNGIFASNADGTAWTALDTGNDYNWTGPRVDDTAAYYWHAGALLKRLK